tara:strand:- start:391 stop:639 length:249 start_codon:yes stop_codon:yes gene_type:complete
MDKLETLSTALAAREEEIFNYQVNIDNFTLALAKIKKEHAGKRGMKEFSKDLTKRLEETKVEQLKAIIIRDVLADQLNSIDF